MLFSRPDRFSRRRSYNFRAMPELPEVETVRRSLEPCLMGRTIQAVELLRPDVVTGSATPAALLVGQTVTALQRHGKQLAMVGSQRGKNGSPARCICVHLGMTGSLRYFQGRTPPGRHNHVVWQLQGGGRVLFADPRRFGGLWTFASRAALLERRWAVLGPDALTVSPTLLHARLMGTRRPLKSALLDQSVVAGLGNIYVDELLHACGLHPCTPAGTLTFAQVGPLVRRMRRLLGRAIEAGGSTVRDYVDGTGRQGGFQLRHQVYGRAGEQCRGCGAVLEQLIVGGRTTVFCSGCQRSAKTQASRVRVRKLLL